MHEGRWDVDVLQIHESSQRRNRRGDMCVWGEGVSDTNSSALAYTLTAQHSSHSNGFKAIVATVMLLLVQSQGITH